MFAHCFVDFSFLLSLLLGINQQLAFIAMTYVFQVQLVASFLAGVKVLFHSLAGKPAAHLLNKPLLLFHLHALPLGSHAGSHCLHLCCLSLCFRLSPQTPTASLDFYWYRLRSACAW